MIAAAGSISTESRFRSKSPASPKQLRWYEEAPSVLQFNRFIRSGYRAGYTYPEALYSIFQLHNETGNIWSHLLPAFILFSALFTISSSPFPEEYWLSDIVNICASLLCFFGSIGYHTCMACDHHYHHWIRIDVCGIYSLLIASQVDVFRYGFPCHPILINLVITVYCLVGLLGVSLSLRAKSPLMRGLPLLALVSIRLTLLALRLLLGSQNFIAWQFYAGAELLSFIGGVINISRFPECLFKSSYLGSKDDRAHYMQVGLFDYWFNSHQIMHIFVTVAIFLMRYGLASDCHFISNNTICTLE